MAGSWGRKGFVSSDNCQLQFTAEEAKAGTGGRNQASRDQAGTLLTALLPKACSACFLVQPRPTGQEVALSIVG